MSKVLHMLSGGRDSLLSAAKNIEKGNTVYLITFDNGCIHNIKATEKVVKELKNIYGSESIVRLQTVGIGLTFNSYLQEFNYKSVQYLYERGYKQLVPHMMNCLCCNSAMYTHAIAIAKAYDINIVSSGIRKDGGFITDTKEFLNVIAALMNEYDITMELPVYDLNSDFDRKKQLDERGLPTKVKEPQCYIGMKPLDSDKIDVRQYVNWFYANLLNMMRDDIDGLATFYKVKGVK